MTPYQFDEKDRPYWEHCLQCGALLDEETDSYLCLRCHQAFTGPLAGAERFTVYVEALCLVLLDLANIDVAKLSHVDAHRHRKRLEQVDTMLSELQGAIDQARQQAAMWGEVDEILHQSQNGTIDDEDLT
jgi:hypothetical protein